jgi:non-lysosomal glucosylceramidase
MYDQGLGTSGASRSIGVGGTRLLVALLLAAVGAALTAGSALAAPAGFGNAGFGVPSVALTKSLGVIPAQMAVAQPAYLQPHFFFPLPGNDELTASQERGISLGGIGAGSFEINQAGTFGPWNFGNGTHEWRTLPQAAFHVYEGDGSSSTTRTLAVNGTGPFTNEFYNEPTPAYPSWSPGVDPAWPTLSPADATYSSLFPFGWITYKDAAHGGPFQADISTRFWSPIVPGNDESSSMPVAYFDVHIANHTRRTLTESVMFTFPNAVAHVANDGPDSWLGGPGLIDTSILGTGHSTRTGLSSQFNTDRRNGIAGVTLGATDASNTPDTQNSDWTIATQPARGQTLSYTTSWNGNGSGTDVLNAFKADDGTLPDAALDSSHSAGAIAVKVRLAPGQSTTIPYILAWDFPQTVYTSGSGATATTTVWMRRYTSYFGAKQDAQNNYIPGTYQPNQGWNIADRLLSEHDANLADVYRWWAPIAYNPRVSASLRAAALNQLAYLLTSSFWVSGLVSDSATATLGQRLGTTLPDTHLFAIETGSDGGDESVMSGDVISYDALALDDLYPNGERDYLRAVTQALSIETAQGQPLGINNMGSLQPGSPYVGWQDGPGNISHNGQYLFRVAAYYNKTHDSSLLNYAYPQMLALFDAEQTRYGLSSTSLLPTGNGTTFDLLPVNGNGVFPATIWLTDLDSMIAATKAEQALGQNSDLATPALLASLQTQFDATKAAFEQALWNPTFDHYNFDTGTASVYDQGVFSATTFENQEATAAGMPPILDPTHLQTELQAEYNDLYAPFTEPGTGQHIGAINLVSNTTTAMPDGGVFGSLNPVFFASDASAREIWTGQNYPLAAEMIAVGRATHNHTLVGEGRTIANAVASETDTTGYSFQAPEAQGILNDDPSQDTNEDPAPVDPSTAVLKPDQHRNLSYGRALDIWDALTAEDPAASNPGSNNGWGWGRDS